MKAKIKETQASDLTVAQVWNARNVLNRKTKGKVFKMPSLTVPDQTLSIRQLLDRYAKGLPIEGARVSIFEEEDQPTRGINPRTLDLVDVQEMQMKNEETIEKLKQQVAAERAKADKAKKDAIRREIEEHEKEIERRFQSTGKTGEQTIKSVVKGSEEQH